MCQICSDPRRDKSVICVVEQPKDLISLEKTGACKWVYHVLGGHIAPLEGIEPGDLTIKDLVARVNNGDVKELIMATNPNIAGDGTALYISSLVRTTSVKITRLARGLPTGTTIEYASGECSPTPSRAGRNWSSFFLCGLRSSSTARQILTTTSMTHDIIRIAQGMS